MALRQEGTGQVTSAGLAGSEAKGKWMTGKNIGFRALVFIKICWMGDDHDGIAETATSCMTLPMPILKIQCVIHREYAANIGITFKVPEDVFGYAPDPHQACSTRLSELLSSPFHITSLDTLATAVHHAMAICLLFGRRRMNDYHLLNRYTSTRPHECSGAVALLPLLGCLSCQVWKNLSSITCDSNLEVSSKCGMAGMLTCPSPVQREVWVWQAIRPQKGCARYQDR